MSIFNVSQFWFIGNSEETNKFNVSTTAHKTTLAQCICIPSVHMP